MLRQDPNKRYNSFAQFWISNLSEKLNHCQRVRHNLGFCRSAIWFRRFVNDQRVPFKLWKKKRYRSIQAFCDFKEPARPDPIFAFFIFLNLLKRYP